MKSTLTSTSDSGKVAWLGLDVASDKFDCAMRFSDGTPIRTADLRKMTCHEYKRTRMGIKQCVGWARLQLQAGDRLHVVMEATGHYSAEIAAWIRDLFPAVCVTVMPALIIKSYIAGIGLRNKTDRLDAKAIACYGAQCQPEPSANHGETYLKLRALTRAHQGLREQATVVKNQAHANDSEHVPPDVRKLLDKAKRQQLALLEKQQEALLQQMSKVTEADGKVKREVELLCSIKGVSFLSAATVLGELGDLRLYKTSRQLTACAGMNPVVFQSGDKTGQSHISKQGSSRVRRCLYMNTMSAVRYNKKLSERQERLKLRGKPGKVALIANMRVLLTIMRALIINDTPYDPDFLQQQGTPDKPHNENEIHNSPVENVLNPLSENNKNLVQALWKSPGINDQERPKNHDCSTE